MKLSKYSSPIIFSDTHSLAQRLGLLGSRPAVPQKREPCRRVCERSSKTIGSLVNVQPGFSLIEVVIAGGIFAMVAVIGVATLAGIYKVRAVNLASLAKQSAAQVVMDTLAREVRLSDSVAANSSNTGLILTYSDGSTKEFKADFDPADQNRRILRQVAGQNIQTVSSENVSLDQFSVLASSKNDWVSISLTFSAYPANQNIAPLSAGSVFVPRRWQQ